MVWKNNKSVVTMLNERVLGGSRNTFHHDISIYKLLITGPKGRTFMSKFKKPDLVLQSHVDYNDFRIYSNSFQTCCKIGPNVLENTNFISYDRDKRVWDHLYCTCSLYDHPLPVDQLGYAPSLFILSAGNKLRRYDAASGELLQVIYLGQGPHFKKINWETSCHRFTLESTKTFKNSHDIFQTIIVMGVFPLKFVAMFDISKTVFGKTVSHCDFHSDLCILTHRSGFVEVFSLKDMIEANIDRNFNTELYAHCSKLGGYLGLEPKGLPLNVVLKRKPAVLFSIHCNDHLQVDEVLLTYIIQPLQRNMRRSDICDCSVVDLRSKSTLGSINVAFNSFTAEKDPVTYFPDDSGRILRLKRRRLDVFRVDREAAESIKLQFSISDTDVYCDVGSFVQRREVVQLLDGSSGITGYCYEDELNVLAVMVNATTVHSDSYNETYVGFYDAPSGKYLNGFQFNIRHNRKQNSFDDIDRRVKDRKLIMDRFMVLYMEVDYNGKHHCTFFYPTEREIIE